jgi:hypothetical protein
VGDNALSANEIRRIYGMLERQSVKPVGGYYTMYVHPIFSIIGLSMENIFYKTDQLRNSKEIIDQASAIVNGWA